MKPALRIKILEVFMGCIFGAVMVCLIFFQQVFSTKVFPGTISEIKEGSNSNVVHVVYSDSSHGGMKALDLALLSDPNKQGEEFHVGDKVAIRFKRDLSTGMYQTSLIKLAAPAVIFSGERSV